MHSSRTFRFSAAAKNSMAACASRHSPTRSHGHIGDVRGRGLFVGVELVKDRVTKEPFDAKLKLHATIKREAFARGLMVYPMGGTVDGKSGDHVLLAPPFICTERDIDEIVSRLSDAIGASLAAL